MLKICTFSRARRLPVILRLCEPGWTKTRMVDRLTGIVRWSDCLAKPDPSLIFLVGPLKGKVYSANPRIIAELKEKIRDAIVQVQLELCAIVFRSVLKD